ncbi:hypothetical protein ABC345_00990 [Shouchella sp. 1P09AA]|uniref:hypothetical protein n=1 Tax=unclassified Shouchella TaxID=2893065 RepID=UPI0039A19C46
MRYRFITVLHNMKLMMTKNKGTEIMPRCRISNGRQVLDQTFQSKLVTSTLGVHSIDEFDNSVYVYLDGEISDLNCWDEMDALGVHITFLHLRQIQSFIHCLWEVKDNNVYVRDGFLLAYRHDFKYEASYKASLSEIFSFSTAEKGESLFSKTELERAIDVYNPTFLDKLMKEDYDGKNPNPDHLYKNKGSERMVRALYFTDHAKKSAILPLKIMFYCNALECLFTIGNSEVNHKIAERVALILGTSPETRKDLYNIIKKAYVSRSNLTHGQYLKGNDADLKGISNKLDTILRELLSANHEVFSKSDRDMEDFFLNLLFVSASNY